MINDFDTAPETVEERFECKGTCGDKQCPEECFCEIFAAEDAVSQFSGEDDIPTKEYIGPHEMWWDRLLGGES